jgi:isopentenyl diphosphate isomerase/L-lactate dehydrogenase-like FMN-dependent dehydrogenase
MSKQFDFPTEFVTVADYEKVAHKKIVKNALDYYKSGAGDELTLRLNTSAFDR